MQTPANLPVTVYSPESPVRYPGRLLAAMFRDLAASRELAWRLFVRDISAQYRQSILGYVWAFVPPLVASLPFVFLNSQGIVKISGTPIPYAAFAMIGTILWQTFVDSLSSPLKAVSASKSMLTRINFPREAILMAALGMVGFSLMIRLTLLAGVMLWFKIELPATAALFPLGVLALVLTGFAIGLFLTPAGLLYHDVQQGIPIVALFFMYLTPVLYPKPKTGLAGTIAEWNPMSPLIVSARDWLTTGETTQLTGFLIVSLAALVLLFFGWVIYRLALPHLIERIGN
jgi:lipopolysaccharide transport system permease protein